MPEMSGILSGQHPAPRVYSEMLNITVCSICAGEALKLGIAVKFLA